MRAIDFAARKHSDQRRKGRAKEPYINHLTEVACLLAEATAGHDLVAVLGAILHDTIEDTNTTPAELAATFGDEVANLVAEVTDDERLPKHERKLLQIDTAARKSARARLIKIADKTSNLRSLVESPPEAWDSDRKREYVEWAARVVQECRGVNPWLEARFDEVYRRACSTARRRGRAHSGRSQVQRHDERRRSRAADNRTG